MSELKAVHAFDVYEAYTKTGDDDAAQVYLKSEADKVITDLEESHKKEVDKLLMEIVELKDKLRHYPMMVALLESDKKEIAELKHSLELASDECCSISELGVKNVRHHKYKRCLAMAQEWRNYAAFCGKQSSCHNHRGFGKTAEKYTWKECHAWKCVKRWLKLAEKFKEA